MADYIYSMVRARKAVGDKVILDDVTMAFLPGAKIGVVGPNGAGKSTILKIMAGLDQPSNGEARLTPGFSVGILMQEPVLDGDDDGAAGAEAVSDGFCALPNPPDMHPVRPETSAAPASARTAVVPRRPGIAPLFRRRDRPSPPAVATAPHESRR